MTNTTAKDKLRCPHCCGSGIATTMGMEELIKLMAKYGFNNYNLAKALHIHPSTVTYWLKGKRKFHGERYFPKLQALGFKL